MAIVFTKDLTQDNLLMAHNNNILEFQTDIPKNSLRSNIFFFGIQITLYPSTQNIFYINLKEWISTLINYQNYQDIIDVNLTNSYIYNADLDSIFNLTVNIDIDLEDGSKDVAIKNLKFLNGYLQLDNFKRQFPNEMKQNEVHILHKSKQENPNQFYMRYWTGYPFDMTIYTQDNDIKIKNTLNLTEHTFLSESDVNRIFLSDGRTDTSIEDVLTLDFGYNKLEIEGDGKLIHLIKEDGNCEGVYLKFMNHLGGWNYWLFNRGEIRRKFKDLGELENDFNNLRDTIAPTIQIGKVPTDTIILNSDVITEEDFLILEALMESPKVYLFKGVPFSKNNYNDWIEVSVKADNTIQKAKNNLNQLIFNIELPSKNYRSL